MLPVLAGAGTTPPLSLMGSPVSTPSGRSLRDVLGLRSRSRSPSPLSSPKCRRVEPQADPEEQDGDGVSSDEPDTDFEQYVDSDCLPRLPRDPVPNDEDVQAMDLLSRKQLQVRHLVDHLGPTAHEATAEDNSLTIWASTVYQIYRAHPGPQEACDELVADYARRVFGSDLDEQSLIGLCAKISEQCSTLNKPLDALCELVRADMSPDDYTALMVRQRRLRGEKVDMSLATNLRFLDSLVRSLPDGDVTSVLPAIVRLGATKPGRVSQDAWWAAKVSAEHSSEDIGQLRMMLYKAIGYDKHEDWCKSYYMVEDATEERLMNASCMSVLITSRLHGLVKVDTERTCLQWNEKTKLWESRELDVLAATMCDELVPLLKKYLDNVNTTLALPHENFPDKNAEKGKRLNPCGDPILLRKRDSLNRALDELTSGKSHTAIVKHLKKRMKDSTFPAQINSQLHLLPFKGGKIIDLRTLEVRDRVPTDLFTFEATFTFRQSGYTFAPPPSWTGSGARAASDYTSRCEPAVEGAPVSGVAVGAPEPRNPFPRVHGPLPEHDLDLSMMELAGEAEQQWEERYPNAHAFLLGLCKGDRALLANIALIDGYAFTGETDRREGYVNYGSGNNGKSTLENVLAAILGDFFQSAHPSLLTRDARDANSHTAGMNQLLIARFAAFSEASEEKINAQIYKRMTGGTDRMNARGMHKEGVQFVPRFKVQQWTNHLPMFDALDVVRKRICPVPFAASFEETDENTRYASGMVQHADELGSLLCEAACLYYKRPRFAHGSAISRAKENYTLQMSPTMAFLRTCRMVTAAEDKDFKAIKITRDDLRRAYWVWFLHVQIEFDAAKHKRLDAIAFGKELTALKLAEGQLHNGTRVYYGVTLSDEVAEAYKKHPLPPAPKE